MYDVAELNAQVLLYTFRTSGACILGGIRFLYTFRTSGACILGGIRFLYTFRTAGAWVWGDILLYHRHQFKRNERTLKENRQTIKQASIQKGYLPCKMYNKMRTQRLFRLFLQLFDDILSELLIPKSCNVLFHDGYFLF